MALQADGQNVVDALMSFALTADDSCSRRVLQRKEVDHCSTQVGDDSNVLTYI